MEKKTTLALCCIVKNEEKVFPRLVESVREIIDYWVIIDTGSTDSTRELIPKLMGNIPGELHERPWLNFGHNRTELCELAKGKADYLLLLDADMTLTLDGFDKNTLVEDGYHLKYSGPLDYIQMLLVLGKFDWKYIGVTHEYIMTDHQVNVHRVDGLIVNHHLDGGMRADKLERDLNLLRHGLIDEPGNPRYFFYLAQTLKDMDKYEEALATYQQRIKIGGWPEEVWYSMYQSGRMLEKLERIPEARTAYIEAFEYHPNRAETLFYAARMCRHKKLFNQAIMFLIMGKSIVYPESDMLFIEVPIYKYLIDFELSISLYWVGKYEKSLQLCEALLREETLPQNIIKACQSNKQFCLDAINRDATKDEKVLITGAGGMLGNAVFYFYKQKYNNILATDIELNEEWLSYLDVRDKAACASLFDSYKPTIVIHLAGITDMERCEEEPEEAHETNIIGTKNILELAVKANTKIIYVSSAEAGINETGVLKAPESVYGKTKYQAEGMLSDYLNAWVFRVGWLFGSYKKDKKFIHQIYDQIKGGLKEVRAVDDKSGSPVYTFNAVEAMYFISLYGESGLWNLANGECTRYEMAQMFVKLMGKEQAVKVLPEKSEYFKETYFAPRGESTALIGKRAEDKGFHYILPWQEALGRYVNEIRQYEQEKEHAVVIVADDKNKGQWGEFLDAFDKNWDSEIDCNVYFLSGNESVDRAGITCVETGGETLGETLRRGLQQVPESRILLLKDDYILQERVEKEFFEQAFALMGAHSMNRMGLFYESAEMKYESMNIKVQRYQVHKVTATSEDITLMHGMWNKGFLLSCIMDMHKIEDIIRISKEALWKNRKDNHIYHCLGHKNWYRVGYSKPPDAPQKKKLKDITPKKRSSLSRELTVLMPAYNRPDMLRESLQSLVDQTYQNFRLVVYDDASQEDLSGVIKEFAGNMEIKYVKGAENRGEGYSRQRLLEQVDTPYFAWMDSDDKAMPKRFEKQMATIKELDVDAVYCQMKWFPTGGVIKVDVSKYTSWEGILNNTTTPTGLFKRVCAAVPFNYVRYGNDVAWLYSLMIWGIKFACVNQSLYLYRKHDDRVSVEKRQHDWEKLLQDNKKRVEFLYNQDRFVVVSMYTVGTPYEEEVNNLEESALKFKVPHEIYAVPDKGKWERNTHQKVGVIRDALNKYKKPVVWTDADSVFEQFPKLFNKLSCDISAHKIVQWNEILSGTVYFDYNDTVLGFLDEWEEMNDAGEGPDAPNMQFLIETREDLIYEVLPAEYVKIFDNPHQRVTDPVIVHNQASRRLKKLVGLNKDTWELRKKAIGHKTCAIVGNGPSNTDLSGEIDKAFVMRCNNFQLGREYPYIGSRVDINISSLLKDIIPTTKVEYLVLGMLPISDTMYQKYTDAKGMHKYWVENLQKLIDLGVDAYGYGDNDKEMAKMFQVISGAINAFPTVGILAIALARAWGFKKIIVTGFTFFESKKSHYFSDKKIIPSAHHNVKAEKMLLKSWVEYDKQREWVLDELTKEALYGDS